MADSAPAPVMQKAKKATKPKKPTDHPKYIEMVVAALKELKERGGCSKSKILKYIMVNYKVSDERTVNTHLKVALRNGVKTGVLKQTKGTGASGSFRLGDAAKKAPAKPKTVVKKPAAKKPATKKTTATKKTKSPKKVAKKPAAKKTPTKKVVKKPKSPKKVAKKPASKKPSKSPKKVAKKPAKKTAAKKTKA